jgi:diguanylate cyclase (GGDEF)-like protein
MTCTDLSNAGSTERRRPSPPGTRPLAVPAQDVRPAPATQPGSNGDGWDHRLSHVLRDFAHTMGTDFPIQAILDHLVGQIVAILPVTAAGVTLIADGADPRYIAASDAAALRYEQLQTELDEGPCLLAYRSGEAVSVADLLAEQRFPRFTPRALEAGLRAVFTFPLRHGSQPLVALALYRDTPGPLSAAAMEAAQTLADVAAAYLLNAQARLDLLQAGQKSRQQALHDALTGLPNRTLILDRLDQACRRNRRSRKICAVLFIDLDRLKTVNDTYGHAAGDELLVAAGTRLAGLIRPGDTLGRISGDEFVMLCEDLEDLPAATTIAGRLLSGLAHPFTLSSASVDITASIGIAHTQGRDRTPEELLDDADSAMYQAKRQGGNRQQVFDPDLKHVTDHHSELERDLQGAAARGELHTAYQLIVTTADGRITGFEALVGWDHPTHGPISPATLIPLAEQSGLIQQQGSWVLRARLHGYLGDLPPAEYEAAFYATKRTDQPLAGIQ